MGPKVSVLMPSLNVAPFIRQCLDSVISQTLTDIEVICIDAGSTDGTYEALREYERSDPRITVLRSEVRSYGHQMNMGLDAATGEYVGIVETDDWVEHDMFERLWTAAHGHDVDLAKCNYFWHTSAPDKEDVLFENLSRCPYRTTFRPRDERSLFEAAPAIWSGVYRLEMLERNGIRFNETPGASYQDTSFHFMVCACADSAYLIEDALHHYRTDNTESSVNSPGKVYCICDEMHYFEEFLNERPALRTNFEQYYMTLKYEKYRWNYERLAAQFQWEFLEVFHRDFSAHRAAGLLDASNFDETAWHNVNEIIDSRVRFFRSNCKAYATRPIGDALPQAVVVKQAEVAIPIVSIIIPAYNDDAYIRESVGSVLSQTCQDVEIICVDDGSEDSTLDVIVELADADSRITVLHQENEGQSAARNHGLRVAHGKFVLFLDGDDALREDAVLELVSIAEQTEADIVYFDGETIFDPPSLRDEFPNFVDVYSYNLKLSKPIDGVTYFCQSKRDDRYRASACMALFRHSYLQDIGVTFIEGILHEDNAFTITCMLGAHRIWHTTARYYLRRIRSGSTMTQKKSFLHLYGLLSSVTFMREIIATMPYDEELQECASLEMSSLISQLRSAYALMEDPFEDQKKLTATERLVLDALTDRVHLIEALQREQDIKRSLSFRIGRLLTYPGRLVRDSVRVLQNSQSHEVTEDHPASSSSR